MINEERLAQVFSGTEGIIATYFFGSQVKGKTDIFSDYDFAVLLEASWEEDKRFAVVGDLLFKTFAVVGEDNADVVDLLAQPLWFQRVVVQTGKVIYQTDNEKRKRYETELIHKCLQAGLAEYAEEDKMRKQDVQINFDTIEENLQMLERLSHLSYDEFITEFWYLQSAVRLLQTTIGGLVDISRYVIHSLNLPTAETYSQVPKVLAEAGYINEKTAAIYVQMMRFRNLVVHHYYRVDAKEIYRILTEELNDLKNWHDRLVKIIEVDVS